MLVSVELTFDAAHNLPAYAGKCERLHGHTYRVRVVCEAPVDPASGLAIDFAAVKRALRERVIDPLDHTYLNETLPTPSAENLAVWAWQRLAGNGLPLTEVQVFESPECSVTYRGESPP